MLWSVMALVKHKPQVASLSQGAKSARGKLAFDHLSRNSHCHLATCAATVFWTRTVKGVRGTSCRRSEGVRGGVGRGDAQGQQG